MRKLALLAVVTASLGLVLSVGCAGRQKLSREENRVKKGVISLSASTIKIKKAKYDIEFGITNESDKPILIYLSDMTCFKGNEQGGLKHTFFNTGERTIDFRANEAKQFRLVCTLGESYEGDPRILVRRVYSNPSGDGVTKGSVLVENVEWILKKKS